MDELPDTIPLFPDVPALFGESLREAVESGEIDEALIDDKVEHVLNGMASIGCFDERPDGALDTPEHRELVREIATDGAVLLQNDGTLPLDGVDSLAVVGPNADTAKLGGGGSSEVSAFTQTSPVEGLEGRAVDITVPVQTTGDRQGKAVVQVYVSKSVATVATPERELAGFQATSLDPGEKEAVEMTLYHSDFAYYDEENGWSVADGEATVLNRRSSREIHG